MLVDKLDKSLEAQKLQLADLISNKEQLKSQLKSTLDNILSLRGAIAALEYAKTIVQEDAKANSKT